MCVCLCLSVVIASSVSTYVFVWCLDVWAPWLLPSVCRLVDALRDFGCLDWQFSALVCKTLWNYSDKMTSSLSCFGAEETELLIEQLEVYLGEELCTGVCVCVRACVRVVCVHMHASVRPIVQRYALLSVFFRSSTWRASCGVCPWRSPRRDKSIPPWHVEEWVLSCSQTTLGACEDKVLWSYTTIVWRNVLYYINPLIIYYRDIYCMYEYLYTTCCTCTYTCTVTVWYVTFGISLYVHTVTARCLKSE